MLSLTKPLYYELNLYAGVILGPDKLYAVTN
jgi:hypothetical protein